MEVINSQCQYMREFEGRLVKETWRRRPKKSPFCLLVHQMIFWIPHLIRIKQFEIQGKYRKLKSKRDCRWEVRRYGSCYRRSSRSSVVSAMNFFSSYLYGGESSTIWLWNINLGQFMVGIYIKKELVISLYETGRMMPMENFNWLW